MNKTTSIALLTLLSIAAPFPLKAADDNDLRTINVFNGVDFYDGYNTLDIIPEDDFTDGVLRHSTHLYAQKLSDAQLDEIGEHLKMNIRIKALCDNYDRIGNINLALVPKGSESYRLIPEDDYFGYYLTDNPRIELGRFVTPFMDKNKTPNIVPYSFDVDYLSYIFRDSKLRAQYDFWIEFELFGIPYAANQQIAGCAGCNDVFRGFLDFETSGQSRPVNNGVLVPITIKNPEYKANNLNNYQEKATDEIGYTVKTYTFEVPENVSDGQIVLITSNHGANSGGEEYNRRWHYIFFDYKGTPLRTESHLDTDVNPSVNDYMVLQYRPGRTSCEPFRKYNTQPNGIYGYSVMTDRRWQLFSNWCPGDVIDNRVINLGPVAKGQHSITIFVPTAQFADNQGDFPVSMFFQGVTEGSLPGSASVNDAALPDFRTKVIKENGTLRIESSANVWNIDLYDTTGNRVRSTEGNSTLNIAALPYGVYFLNIDLTDGIIETHKLILP